MERGGILWWLRRQFCRAGWHTSDGVRRKDLFVPPPYYCRAFERCTRCRSIVNERWTLMADMMAGCDEALADAMLEDTPAGE